MNTRTLKRAGTLFAIFFSTSSLTLLACGSDDTNNRGTGGGSSTTGGSGTGATGATGTGATGASTMGGGTGTGGLGGEVAPTACASTTTLTTETLIADYECLELKDDGSGELNIGWFGDLSLAWMHGAYVYGNTEPTDTQPWTVDQVTVHSLGPDSPGYDGSEYAIHLSMDKPAENWGFGTGIWYGSGGDTGCIDASAFTGISFWQKGSTVGGTGTLSIGTFDTVEFDPNPIEGDPSRGGCTLGDGCASYMTEFTLTEDWSQVTLAWSDFTSEQVGAPPLDGSKLMGSMNFHIPTWAEAETMDFWLDNVEFTGGASQLPRTCPAGGSTSAGGSGSGNTGNVGGGGAGG